MDHITIRPAQDADLESLYSLYTEFHDFHARYLPRYLNVVGELSQGERANLDEKIKEIITANGAVILIAELPGHVVGFAEIYLKPADLSARAIVPGAYAHLQSLGVKEEFRRQGAGRQLLHAAEDWARQRGATELRLDVWKFSAGPEDFYKEMGYRTIRCTLAKSL